MWDFSLHGALVAQHSHVTQAETVRMLDLEVWQGRSGRGVFVINPLGWRVETLWLMLHEYVCRLTIFRASNIQLQ